MRKPRRAIFIALNIVHCAIRVSQITTNNEAQGTRTKSESSAEELYFVRSTRSISRQHPCVRVTQQRCSRSSSRTARLEAAPQKLRAAPFDNIAHSSAPGLELRAGPPARKWYPGRLTDLCRPRSFVGVGPGERAAEGDKGLRRNVSKSACEPYTTTDAVRAPQALTARSTGRPPRLQALPAAPRSSPHRACVCARARSTPPESTPSARY